MRRADKKGVPKFPGGTLALIGDLKGMSDEWLIGTSMAGYGVTLSVGVGIPIPIISEEVLSYAALSDEELMAPIVDYSKNYPNREQGNLGFVSYAQLKTGTIEVQGKTVRCGGLSSLRKARKIADILKGWIKEGKFNLTKAVESLPSADSAYHQKPLNERRVDESR